MGNKWQKATEGNLPEIHQIVLWYKDGRYMDKKYLVGSLIKENGIYYIFVNQRYKERLSNDYSWLEFPKCN